MTQPTPFADLILHHGQFTTLARANPSANAVAIGDGLFLAVGADKDVMALAGPETKVVDLEGRRVLPGLIDNHLHIIRGGLNFNMELRWDGVRSLADAMSMLKRQVARHAVAAMGARGRRLQRASVRREAPADASPNSTPSHRTRQSSCCISTTAQFSTRAALRAVGYTKDTPNPPGGEIVRDPGGTPTGLLLAKPNAGILYATLAKGPKLPFDYQLNSTRHFMRELNRLGVTGVIDAGGGFQNYPEDYAVVEKLAADGQLTIRIAYNLFTQKPKGEKEDFVRWAGSSKYQAGR